MNTAFINAKAIKVTVWDENGNQFEYKFGNPKGPAGLRVGTAYKVDYHDVYQESFSPVMSFIDKREMTFNIKY